MSSRMKGPKSFFKRVVISLILLVVFFTAGAGIVMMFDLGEYSSASIFFILGAIWWAITNKIKK
jgi:succinate dehydrogenase/fumarate reductase cytochrome b subunit